MSRNTVSFHPRQLSPSCPRWPALIHFTSKFHSPLSPLDTEDCYLPLVVHSSRALYIPPTNLCFQGKSEYLDNLVPHVTVTLLDIMPSNRLVFNGTLAPATDKTYMGSNGAPDQVHMHVRGKSDFLANCQRRHVDRELLVLVTRCRHLVWQLAALTQVLHLSLPLLFTLRRLEDTESSFVGEQRRVAPSVYRLYYVMGLCLSTIACIISFISNTLYLLNVCPACAHFPNAIDLSLLHSPITQVRTIKGRTQPF